MALTRRQKQVFDFLVTFINRQGYSPSFEEIGAGLELSSLATVHKHLQTLEKKGFIRRGYNQSRSVEVVAIPASVPFAKTAVQPFGRPKTAADEGNHHRSIAPMAVLNPSQVLGNMEFPLLGRIAAGQPVEAIPNAETFSFGDFTSGRGNLFVLRVKGDSMVDDHICSGDYILVEGAQTADNGDIVVALIEGTDATLKRFFRESGGKVRLQPANAQMDPILVPARDVKIQGRVVGVLPKILKLGQTRMQRGRVIVGMLAIGVVLGATASVRAEEITLKDGQKIIGTIVGYEKDMFRIETTYGIALVRKDKVASIQVSKPAGADQAAKPDAVSPVNPPEAAKPAAPPPAVVKVPPSTPLPVGPPADPPPMVKPPASEAATGKLAMPPPPPVSHPLDVPIPAHLQDHIDGNTFFSDTFQFSMYKPPDWKIIADVPKETGSGIMAMGTDDEMTLLIVDRQVWSGTPKLTSDQVEAKLRQTYQDYQRISENSFQCDGQSATYRTFTGILDGAEWHGVAVHVIHGNTVFGIIGLTSSESYQFQEAIFNKIVRTFHFTATPASTGTSASP